MVWSRHEETLEFGYRPVTETASFEDKQIYEVVVSNKEGKQETYQTTEEHPFWIHEFGWLPASSLMAGMTLVDRNNETLTVVSQTKLNKTDTVYNFTVDEFHTYHIGELGVWVHNANCIFNSIKDAPTYPTGFTNISNGLKKVTVNNRELLAELRKHEAGIWKKFYRDGLDANGNKVSIHYFQSKSGKVFNVKVKQVWSN